MKSQRKKILLLFFYFITIQYVSAQLVNDVAGVPLRQMAYAEFDGSPFFLSYWSNGTIKLSDNTIISYSELKFDQLKDALVYKDKNGEELYFIDPIKEFSLIALENGNKVNKIFRNGFPAFKNLTNNSYYQVIADGKLKLLKKNIKTVSEIREFNSATITKKINENLNYYVLKDNNLILFKNKDSLKALANLIDFQKSQLLIDFVHKNNLILNSDEGLKILFDYYNSIN